MATSLSFGLIFATALVLILAPVSYFVMISGLQSSAPLGPENDRDIGSEIT